MQLPFESTILESERETFGGQDTKGTWLGLDSRFISSSCLLPFSSLYAIEDALFFVRAAFRPGRHPHGSPQPVRPAYASRTKTSNALTSMPPVLLGGGVEAVQHRRCRRRALQSDLGLSCNAHSVCLVAWPSVTKSTDAASLIRCKVPSRKHAAAHPLASRAEVRSVELHNGGNGRVRPLIGRRGTFAKSRAG